MFMAWQGKALANQGKVESFEYTRTETMKKKRISNCPQTFQIEPLLPWIYFHFEPGFLTIRLRFFAN